MVVKHNAVTIALCIFFCASVSFANVSSTPDSWESVNVNENGMIWSATSGGTHTLIGSDGGTLRVSSNGTDWNVHAPTLQAGGRYSKISYGDGIFLAGYSNISAGDFSLVVIDDSDLSSATLQLAPPINGSSSIEITDLSYAPSANKFGISLVSYHPAEQIKYKTHFYTLNASSLVFDLIYSESSTFSTNFIGHALSPTGLLLAFDGSDDVSFYHDLLGNFVQTKFSDSLRAITYGAGKWMIVGDSSANTYQFTGYLSPPNTSTRDVPFGYWNDIQYQNSMYVAVGDNGDTMHSPDGVSWTFVDSNITENLSAVSYNPNFGWIAVGGNGTVLKQQSQVNLIQGSPNDDHLNGTASDDRILSGSGDDSAYAYEGDDYLSGYNGNDLLNGGYGDDVLLGGGGEDELVGGNGRDLLRGDSSPDKFIYQATSDSLRNNPDRIIDFNPAEDILDLTGLGYDGVIQGYPTSSTLGFLFNPVTGRTYLRDTGTFWIVFDGDITFTTLNVSF